MAVEASGWNGLHGRFQVSRIDHSALYGNQDGPYTNGAEGYFSRMRQAGIGHHHHIAGSYLTRYAQESAWREDHRRVDNGKQTRIVTTLALAASVSVDWYGYWKLGQVAV